MRFLVVGLLVLPLTAPSQDPATFDDAAGQMAKTLPEQIAATFSVADEVERRLLAREDTDAGRAQVRRRLPMARAPKAYHLETEPPFAVFVEVADDWDAAAVARRHASLLRAYHETFLQAVGKRAIATPNRPHAVIVFRHKKTNTRYLAGFLRRIPEQIATHTELDQRRMTIWGRDSRPQLLHEATHLLAMAYRRVHPAPHALPIWFEEGLAEWLPGDAPRGDPVTGQSPPLFGGLSEHVIKTLVLTRSLKSNLTLRQLLDATVATRIDWMRRGDRRWAASYAQGAALLHFLHHYDVDAEGRVKFGAGGFLGIGRHRAGLRRYVEFALDGKNGRFHGSRAAFQEALDLEDEQLDELAARFERWTRWVLHKHRKQALIDGRIVAWTHHTDSDGASVGQPTDDVLPR